MAIKVGGTTVIDDNRKIQNTGSLELEAISTTIADTAVDIFIYDTRKDSDGGAWRKRTQHTSWYNETLNTATRGSRREFPAVAVIVVTAASTRKLYIYDGDDPDLPMWMIIDTTDGQWPQTEFSSLYALNGIIALGSASNTQPLYETRNRLDLYYFVSDKIESSGAGTGGNYYGIVDGLVNRTIHSTSRGSPAGNSVYNLVNMSVNDVAMTVLPNAPIDSATGLPIPTIAVATNGGVSVIKDDGTVVDIVSSYAPTDNSDYVEFTKSGGLVLDMGQNGDRAWLHTFSAVPSSDTTITVNTKNAASGLDPVGWYDVINLYASDLTILSSGGTEQIDTCTLYGDTIVATTGLGMTFIDEYAPAPSRGMANYITSSYNTGWMNGDIKLATLSDTDDTDVTGSELVTNGTFDSNISGWTASGSNNISWSSGTISVARNNSTAFGAYQGISTVVGQDYTVSFDVTAIGSTTTARLYVGSSVEDDDLAVLGPSSANTTGSFSGSFTATSTTTYIHLGAAGVTTGTASFDNVSVSLAEEDRSVNGNDLQVFGTVTKNPVATGADLVAYSGFDSGSDYLYQPYNSDLDFGTGDFCISFWLKTDPTETNSTAYIFEKSSPSDSGNNRIEMRLASSTQLQAYMTDLFVSTNIAVPSNSWCKVDFLRRSGVAYVYVNSEEKVNISRAGSVSDSNSRLVVGNRAYFNPIQSTNSLGTHSISLFRISATAPSAEQIKKIYEDEKVLFQENAQATLYGSSDAVTALAYDDSTDLLHAGTSAGRSVFQGLRRVDNTTDAVGSAISASNGMVADD